MMLKKFKDNDIQQCHFLNNKNNIKLYYTECLRKMSPVFNIFISQAKIGIFWFCFLQNIDSFMYRCSKKNYDDNLISFHLVDAKVGRCRNVIVHILIFGC